MSAPDGLCPALAHARFQVHAVVCHLEANPGAARSGPVVASAVAAVAAGSAALAAHGWVLPRLLPRLHHADAMIAALDAGMRWHDVPSPPHAHLQ